MSVVEYRNAKGEVRYQPQHPDGRRLYDDSEWKRPYPSSAKEIRESEFPYVAPWDEPMLYRSKRRASRKVSQLIASEFNEAQTRFKAVAK